MAASGRERIIVFTTNHKEKMDPALIRQGMMDKHIEMSYCLFEGFKVLAKNYLDIVEHGLFGDIQRLLVCLGRFNGCSRRPTCHPPMWQGT